MTHFRIHIKNGRIWDGERFFEGNVAIKDGKIAALGDTGDFNCSFTYDAEGAIVSAGLVDIHTHLRYLSDPVYETNGEQACFPCGVTSAADGGTKYRSSHPQTSLLRTKLFVPVSIRNGVPIFSRIEEMREYYGERVMGVKAYFDKSMIGDCGAETFGQICEYAHSQGLKVMVHCTDSPTPMSDMMSCMSEGDICTHAYHGVGHTASEDNFGCLRYAKECGIILDIGFADGYHTDFDILKKAIELGLGPDTVSTDLTSAAARMYGSAFGMTLAMNTARALGMNETELMRAVTSCAARAAGFEAPVGYLRVGEAADVCVLDYGNYYGEMKDRNGRILEITQGYKCLLTVSDGDVVYRSDLK